MLIPLLAAVLAFPVRAEEPADLQGAVTAARVNFLTQQPGAPLAGAVVSLPPSDDRTVESLRKTVKAIGEIQRGCVYPCDTRDSVLGYRAQVLQSARALGLTPDQTDAVLKHYMPLGRPRPRLRRADGSGPVADGRSGGRDGAGDGAGANGAGASLVTPEQAAAYARSRAQAGTRADDRALSMKNAVAYAQALRPNPPAAGPDGPVSAARAPAAFVAGGPSAGPLSAAQLAALNRLPAAEVPAALRAKLGEPPPPAAQPAPKPAARPAAPAETSNPDGLIARSLAYWDRIGEDPHTGTAMRATAATARAFLTAFGLKSYEDSAFHTADVAADPRSTKADVLKAGAKTAGHAVLFAAGMLPTAVVAKPLAWAANGVKLVAGGAKGAEAVAAGTEALASRSGEIAAPAEGAEAVVNGVKVASRSGQALVNTAQAASNGGKAAAATGQAAGATSQAANATAQVAGQTAVKTEAAVSHVSNGAAAGGNDADRVAQLQQRIADGKPLSRADAAWLAEATNGKAAVRFHTTDAMDAIRQSERLAGTAEGRAYASRKLITNRWRQLLSGVKPKDGTIVLQGKAAELFSSHEATGLYSGMKRLAGQQVTSGKGDIVITKAFFDEATGTLTVTEARMVTEGEKQFLLQSKGWATARLWGRRAVLDPAITAATGFIVAPNKQGILEYALGDPGKHD
jgi:hypothetical protein